MPAGRARNSWEGGTPAGEWFVVPCSQGSVTSLLLPSLGRGGSVCSYVKLSSNKTHFSWVTLNMVLKAVSKWNSLQFVVRELNGGFPGRLMRTG